ncbi:unnamed protein product [Blepharisma stoltei]|uniref:Uncharacterized protein n=1 Tax=Blepharisma stoltei TaxID=1481888 RepID=A0AAU9IPC7_9CILI|nr:unnamed protein product [Blepharisma stoltei]
MSKQSQSPMARFLQTENIRVNSQSKTSHKTLHRKIQTSSEFQIQNLMQERKKLDLRVKTLENRIKFLETERLKSARLVDLAKTLNQKRLEIRKKHKESLDFTEKSKNLKAKELENKKKYVSQQRKKRADSLSQTKTKILENKHRASSAVKLESKNIENLIKSREEMERTVAKERAESIIQAARRRKEKLDLKREALKISNEMKFMERMELESKAKKNTQKEIKKLGMAEGTITEMLSKTLENQKSAFKKMMESSQSLNSSFSSQSSISPNQSGIFYSPSLDSTECFDDLKMKYIEYVPYNIIDITNS